MKILLITLLALSSVSVFADTYVSCTVNGKEISGNYDVVRIIKGKLKLQNYSTSYADASKVKTIATISDLSNCLIIGGSAGE